VRIAVSSHNPYNQIIFAPTVIDQVLGTVVLGYEDGSGDKYKMTLSGTTTGNTVGDMAFPGGHKYGVVEKVGSGTWTVGNIDTGIFNLTGGNLICNGTIRHYYGGITVSGGTFHYNNAGAVYDDVRLNGGSVDNSSSAEISSSTHNPKMSWGGNWTFIGSLGAASDLNLGSGNVTLTGNRTVTIQNAATTLTVDGMISDAAAVNGLTKAGPGTLLFTADNDYDGATTVSAGTLHIKYPCLSDDGAVSVATGAILNLDFTGTDDVFLLYLNGIPAAVGEWGAVSSGAANESALLTGTGRLNNGGGLAPAGTWYWDGTDADIPTDGDGGSAGGNGTWSTSVANWDQGVTSHKDWDNTTNDLAIFRTLKGTVKLGTDITLGEIIIDGVDNYVIGDSAEAESLNFGGAANIFVDAVHAEFRAGITGEPNLQCGADYRKIIKMTADGASMALGTVTFGEGATSNPEFWIQGANTACSVNTITSPFKYSFVKKYGSGTWTVGDITCGKVQLETGKLVANGTVTTGWSDFTFNGGTLAGTGTINNENVTVPASGTIAPGDPTGTLTVFNKDCTINGTLLVEVDASQASPNGTLAVDNTLTLGATSVLDVNVTSSPGGTITIVTYDILVGTFDTENIPDGWEIDYGTNAITLTGAASGTLILLK